jgi:glyoxylase-like metal-dependent hydrolase (beta-lactamase superfamily II)
VFTPGHTSNHLAFALREEKTLFSGDHVMGWSTSVISPPDGDMAAYMASLEKLLDRDDVRYWPTHGPSIEDPKTHVRAFIAHRQARAQQILDALASGLTQVSAMVPKMYADVSPNLYPAATRSVLAAVAYLEDQGKLTVAGALNADAVLALR